MSDEKDLWDRIEEEFAFGPVPDDYDEEFDESIFNDPEYDIEDLELKAGSLPIPQVTAPPLGMKAQSLLQSHHKAGVASSQTIQSASLSLQATRLLSTIRQGMSVGKFLQVKSKLIQLFKSVCLNFNHTIQSLVKS